MKIKLLFYLFIISIFSACCHHVSKTNVESMEIDKKQVQELFIDANKKALETESLQIDSLVRAKNWKVRQTATGLRYFINKENVKGKKGAEGMLAELEYEIKLIDETIVYSSKTDGIKKFVIGSGNVESGLEEGILLMHESENYTFIIPSYLAHGLIGDQDKIPAKATLIYEVQLKKLHNPK